MVTEFTCNDCGLRFSVGAYHDNAFPSGYSGQVLLVCSYCGTQHNIKCALVDRGAEFWDVFEILIENIAREKRVLLMAWLRREHKIDLSEARRRTSHFPILLKRGLYEHEALKLMEELQQQGIQAVMSAYATMKNPNFGSIMQDEMYAYPGPRMHADAASSMASELLEDRAVPFLSDAQLNPAAMDCHYCCKKNLLVREWHVENSCPSCKGQLRIDAAWTA